MDEGFEAVGARHPRAVDPRPRQVVLLTAPPERTPPKVNNVVTKRTEYS